MCPSLLGEQGAASLDRPNDAGWLQVRAASQNAYRPVGSQQAFVSILCFCELNELTSHTKRGLAYVRPESAWILLQVARWCS